MAPGDLNAISKPQDSGVFCLLDALEGALDWSHSTSQMAILLGDEDLRIRRICVYIPGILCVFFFDLSLNSRFLFLDGFDLALELVMGFLGRFKASF